VSLVFFAGKPINYSKMEKTDLTKAYRSYYTAKGKPELTEIEPAQFVSLRGKGDPSGEEFSKSIEALYSTAYTLKFIYKGKGPDFTVSKLEGLWWFDEEKYPGKNAVNASLEVPRSEWEYVLLIRIPAFVESPDIEKAAVQTAGKKNIQLARKVRHYTLNEGSTVQMMHTGPFATEPESLEQISRFMADNKLERNGLHHEIYLSDFRKTSPEKLKTILREPVKTL
jgi:hypothetical protein